MKFTIANAQGAMSIDNLRLLISTSALASNIEFVTWGGNSGFIWFNDRAGVNAELTDPSPYQPFVNLWLTAAETATPALTLAQAQQIKSDFVDAIFTTKRQSPIAFTVSAGAFSWDCSDESVTQMSLALGSATTSQTGSLVSSTNTAFSGLSGSVDSSSLVSAINTALGTVVSQANTALGNLVLEIVAAIGPTDGSVAGTINYAIINGTPSIPVADPVGEFLTGGITVSGGSSLSLGSESVSAPLGTFSWTPIGRTSPVTLSATEFPALISAISSRRATLQANRLTLKASVAAAASIPAVIAIDVTSGWPF